MIWLAASASSGTDWSTLLGGIGIGAIVGSAVTGVFTALNGKWQRDHDREMRDKDYGQQALAHEAAHEQELALKQLEDKQRLRNRRLVLLQGGLTEIVQAFIAQSIYVEATKYHTLEASSAWAESHKHFDAARLKLVLDPAGREMMQAYRDIQDEINRAATMRHSQELLFEAQRPDAIEHAEKLAAQVQKILDMTGKAVDRAQEIMEQAAQPVTA